MGVYRVPRSAVEKGFKRKTGLSPKRWFRLLGYSDDPYGRGGNWIKNHLVPGADIGPFDYPPQTEEGWLAVLKFAGTDASTLDEALYQETLPFVFSGIRQWRHNLAGEFSAVTGNPALQNVSVYSPLASPESQRLFLNSVLDMLAGFGARRTREILSAREELVPEWAWSVQEALRPLPFHGELLMSPEINLGPEPPLFTEGQPLSLFQLGVLQAGERAKLAKLSAPELMLRVWPAYYAYYHRPAGAPVPEEFGGKDFLTYLRALLR